MTRLRVVMFSLGLILLSPFTEPANAQSPEWTRCVNKGNAFAADVRIGGCTAVIQSGRETKKNRAAAYTNRGNTYIAKGDYDRAIADQDEAIALDPKLAAAYVNRGHAYEGKNDYDHA